MDVRLFQHIFSTAPKMNPVLAEGVAVRQIELAPQYIDRIWRCAAKLFPEGLEYLGFSYCNPREEFQEKTRKRSGRPPLELSRSDVFMVKYHFALNGKPLVDRPLYLPFTGDAGEIYLRGSRFTISPVLADRCLSVSKGTVFIPVTRDKLTFSQFGWQFNVNGKTKSCFVQKSQIHHHRQDVQTKKLHGNIRAESTLAHYLFCRSGLTGAFATYFGCEVIVGTEEINEEKYPEDQWCICTSTGQKPLAVKSTYYEPTKLRLAIPKDQMNEAVESLVAGFFYLADIFPDRLTLEDIEEPELWCVLFGLITFGNASGEGKLYADFVNHLESLDQYIDEVAREELHDDGIMVDDIYQLFAYIIEHMPDIISRSDVGNMEGKRLVTWKYVLYDIVKSIFYLSYKLRPKNKKVSEKDIVAAFNRGLNPELVMKINSGHGEVTSITTPSDSMIFKHTSNAIPQDKATNNRAGSGDHDRTFTNQALHLHSTYIAAGSILNLPKSDPTGTSRLNVYGEIGPAQDIRIRPEFKAILDDVQKKIQR